MSVKNSELCINDVQITVGINKSCLHLFNMIFLLLSQTSAPAEIERVHPTERGVPETVPENQGKAQREPE